MKHALLIALLMISLTNLYAAPKPTDDDDKDQVPIDSELNPPFKLPEIPPAQATEPMGSFEATLARNLPLSNFVFHGKVKEIRYEYGVKDDGKETTPFTIVWYEVIETLAGKADKTTGESFAIQLPGGLGREGNISIWSHTFIPKIGDEDIVFLQGNGGRVFNPMVSRLRILDNLVFSDEGQYIAESLLVKSNFDYINKFNDTSYFNETMIGKYKLIRQKSEVPLIEGSPEIRPSSPAPIQGKSYLTKDKAFEIVKTIATRYPGPGETEKSLTGKPIDIVANLIFSAK